MSCIFCLEKNINRIVSNKMKLHVIINCMQRFKFYMFFSSIGNVGWRFQSLCAFCSAVSLLSSYFPAPFNFKSTTVISRPLSCISTWQRERWRWVYRWVYETPFRSRTKHFQHLVYTVISRKQNMAVTLLVELFWLIRAFSLVPSTYF